jgi:hypothetical protein
MKNVLKLTLAIAQHFGHEWATALREKEDTFLNASSRGAAFLAIETAYEGWEHSEFNPGIEYPELTRHSTRHTTGSGRIRVTGHAERFLVEALDRDGREPVLQADVKMRGDVAEIYPLAVANTKHQGHVGMVFSNVQGILVALGVQEVRLMPPLLRGVIPDQDAWRGTSNGVAAAAAMHFAYLDAVPA